MPDEEICHLDRTSPHFAKCWGTCTGPNTDRCVIQWRKKGSAEPWETENESIYEYVVDEDAGRDDRTDLEYRCKCV